MNHRAVALGGFGWPSRFVALDGFASPPFAGPLLRLEMAGGPSLALEPTGAESAFYVAGGIEGSGPDADLSPGRFRSSGGPSCVFYCSGGSPKIGTA